MLKWNLPITLTGSNVQLVPLSLTHLEGAKEAASDGKLWELWHTTVPTPDKMEDEIKRRLKLQDDGVMVPFTILDLATQQVLGMTTFCRIENPNKKVEIGFTWYRKSSQKTGINTECKLLLLQHAFEVLGCHSVDFRTSNFNLESRRAIERLGARLDGILRMARIHKNGTIGDTYLYSIIAPEWPSVKAHLEHKLTRQY